MNITLESLGVAIAVFAVLLALWMLGRKKSGHDKHQPKQSFTGNLEEPVLVTDAFTSEKDNLSHGAFEAEVRMLIDYGNKAAAIRVVREKMGLDLKDAKDLVDKMEHGAPIPVADHTTVPVNTHDGDHDIRELAHSGRLIEAIKLARERKGLDLKQAKSYVEQL